MYNVYTGHLDTSSGERKSGTGHGVRKLTRLVQDLVPSLLPCFNVSLTWILTQYRGRAVDTSTKTTMVTTPPPSPTPPLSPPPPPRDDDDGMVALPMPPKRQRRCRATTCVTETTTTMWPCHHHYCPHIDSDGTVW